MSSTRNAPPNKALQLTAAAVSRFAASLCARS